MDNIPNESGGSASPLEAFVRSYVETTGGAWDEIEPQVYDLVVPGATDGLLRITFDPEALPDHPGAQLASFGTPFIDGLLRDALQRGREARLYFLGLNLSPHDLSGRIRRAVHLPPKVELSIDRVRPLHFVQAIYWFQAEFISDQKEQAIVPVAMDLHYGRQVRHLEQILDHSRLLEQAAVPLPEARRLSVAAAYLPARAEALRTIAALANVRGRELSERCTQQVERMSRYYADLRSELAEQSRRGRQTDDSPARLAERRAAIDREEQFRIGELRQKSALRVPIRLLQLLLIEQPKLLVKTTVAVPKRMMSPLEVVWDPLTEAVEAIPCPTCRRPGYTFEFSRLGRLMCAVCATEQGGR